MNVCFKDLLDLEVFPWLVEPFASNINECDSNMQEMLIDLQSDEEARAIFRARGWVGFWIKCNNQFPELWEKVKLFILACSYWHILLNKALVKCCTCEIKIATDSRCI